MIIKSRIMEQASGSLGSITGENGRGGLSLKDKPPPRGTPNAKAVRFTNNIKLISQIWQDIGKDKRGIWEAYAKLNPKIDKLGNIIPQSGWNLFYSTASQIANAGYPILNFHFVYPTPQEIPEVKPYVITRRANGWRFTFEDTFNSPTTILQYQAKPLGKGESVVSSKYTFFRSALRPADQNYFGTRDYKGQDKYAPLKFVIINYYWNRWQDMNVILPPHTQ